MIPDALNTINIFFGGATGENRRLTYATPDVVEDDEVLDVRMGMFPNAIQISSKSIKRRY